MTSFTARPARRLPAGSAIFAADPATKVALASVGRTNDVWFTRAYTAALPALEPIDRVPRIAVLTGAVNQDVWSLRNLGFTADPIATGNTSQLNNPAAANPLDGYDLVFNTAAWPRPGRPRARGSRRSSPLAAGTSAPGPRRQLPVLRRARHRPYGSQPPGNGRSGIVGWNNEGGPASPIVGAFPAQDTAIMDPPTWFTAVPATMTVDGRLPVGYFLAGLWQPDAQSVGARVGRHRPRDQHLRRGATDDLRHEPALPGGSGA